MSISQIITTVTDFFRSIQKKNLSLLIAVSGGSDSVALVYILYQLSELLEFRRIALAHVNHGLRGEESDSDELFVCELSKKLHCEIFCKRLLNLSLNSSSLEGRARIERYNFFQELKTTQGFDFIVTAHTADDQAETVLYRLIRGCGINGLRAIHAIRDDGVLRPLLSVGKNELLTWLHFNGYSYRIDSSNQDIRFRRNYLRHKVLPSIVEMDPSAMKKIASIAEETNRIWPLVQSIVKQWIAKNCINNYEQSFEIKKSGFADKEVAYEALYQLFKEKGIDSSKKHIISLFSNVHRTSGQILFPGGWAFFPLRNSVLFLNEVECGTFSYELKNPGVTEIFDRKIRIIITESVAEIIERNPYCAILDKEKCSDLLIYRTIRADDFLVPLGQTKKKNALTFLSKQGITKVERERIGVVVDSHNNLLWIPAIRINDFCKVTGATTRKIKISISAAL